MFLMSFLFWNFYKSIKRKRIALEDVPPPWGQHKMSIHGFEKMKYRSLSLRKKNHNFSFFFFSHLALTQLRFITGQIILGRFLSLPLHMYRNTPSQITMKICVRSSCKVAVCPCLLNLLTESRMEMCEKQSLDLFSSLKIPDVYREHGKLSGAKGYLRDRCIVSAPGKCRELPFTSQSWRSLLASLELRASASTESHGNPGGQSRASSAVPHSRSELSPFASYFTAELVCGALPFSRCWRERMMLERLI